MRIQSDLVPLRKKKGDVTQPWVDLPPLPASEESSEPPAWPEVSVEKQDQDKHISHCSGCDATPARLLLISRTFTRERKEGEGLFENCHNLNYWTPENVNVLHRQYFGARVRQTAAAGKKTEIKDKGKWLEEEVWTMWRTRKVNMPFLLWHF